MQSIVESATRRARATADAGEEFGVPKIVVVGAGGAGCNSINRMAQLGVKGADLVAVNTDRQHLDKFVSDKVTKILIGKSVTRGLGAGGDPTVGMKAAEVSRNELESVMDGANIVFVVAGMGGGTGTGAAPVIAQIAKEQGAIAIAMVTYPFRLERFRMKQADWGIQKLMESADTVIVIDNNRLVELFPNLPMDDAFKVADEVIARTVDGIVETVTQPSFINLDYADLRAVMGMGGLATISVGEARGQNKVREVVDATLNNVLLDVDPTGAKGALVHITGGPSMTLGEAVQVGELLTAQVDPNAQVIWGARVKPEYEGKMEVISIFTGVTSAFINSPAAGAAGEKAYESLDIAYI